LKEISAKHLLHCASLTVLRRKEKVYAAIGFSLVVEDETWDDAGLGFLLGIFHSILMR